MCAELATSARNHKNRFLFPDKLNFWQELFFKLIILNQTEFQLVQNQKEFIWLCVYIYILYDFCTYINFSFVKNTRKKLPFVYAAMTLIMQHYLLLSCNIIWLLLCNIIIYIICKSFKLYVLPSYDTILLWNILHWLRIFFNYFKSGLLYFLSLEAMIFG